MTEKKEAILTCSASKATIKSGRNGNSVVLVLEAEGKLAGRSLARMLDEAVVVTEESGPKSGAKTGFGKLTKVTLSASADDPVKVRAQLTGHENLQHLVGSRLLVEKGQRELLEEPEEEKPGA